MVGCGGGTHSGAGIAASSDGLVDIGAGLWGQAGLSATEYASGVPNVAAMAFDDAGRLWLAPAAFQDSGDDVG